MKKQEIGRHSSIQTVFGSLAALLVFWVLLFFIIAFVQSAFGAFEIFVPERAGLGADEPGFIEYIMAGAQAALIAGVSALGAFKVSELIFSRANRKVVSVILGMSVLGWAVFMFSLGGVKITREYIQYGYLPALSVAAPALWVAWVHWKK